MPEALLNVALAGGVCTVFLMVLTGCLVVSYQKVVSPCLDKLGGITGNLNIASKNAESAALISKEAAASCQLAAARCEEAAKTCVRVTDRALERMSER